MKKVIFMSDILRNIIQKNLPEGRFVDFDAA